MGNRRLSILRNGGGALVLIAGLYMVARGVWNGPPPPPITPTGVDQQDVELLANAVYEPPNLDAEAERFESSVRIAAQSAIGGLSGRQSDALAEVCVRRLNLLRRPDYAAYLSAIHALGGTTEGAGPLVEDGELWAKHAALFAGSPISLDAIRVQDRWRDGLLSSKPGGNVTSNGGAALYRAPIDVERHRTHVIDVYIPMEVADLLNKRPMKAFYIMSFAWDPATSSWLPWQTSVYDPSNSDAVLPPPWI